MGTSPVFSSIPKMTWATVSAANTAKDGTGTVATIFTGAAVTGSFLQRIACRTLGTNVASVLRVFINNGGANSTPANNSLLAEIALPATTVSETVAQNPADLPMNLYVPPGYNVNVCLATAVAAGYSVIGIGGDLT